MTTTSWLQTWLARTEFGGAGVALAVVLLLALRLLLPRDERGLVRAPLLLLVMHLAVIGLRVALPELPSVQRTLALTALFLLLACLGRGFFVLGMHTVVMRRLSGPVPRILQDVLQVLIYTGAALITLQAAGVEPGSLLTTSALLTAVLGLSLQDTLGNLFAGLAIQAQRPFQVDDWIQFERDERILGRVVEVNWRATKIVTVEHLEVTIPNAALAKAPIVNFSRPQRAVRRQVLVHAPYERPTEQLQALLVAALDGVPGVLRQPAADAVVVAFDERGVQYAVRYFIDRFEQREVIASVVRDRVWYGLQRAGTPFPLPQRAVKLEEASPEAAMRERRLREEQRLESLVRVDLLAALPPEALRTLAERSRTALYASGETIIRQGEAGSELFILRSGAVRVLVDAPQGRSREVAELGPGAFFGEASLLTGEERNATIVASSEVEVIVVGKEAAQAALKANPSLATTLSQLLAARQVQIDAAGAQRGSRPDEAIDRASSVLLARIKGFFSLDR